MRNDVRLIRCPISVTGVVLTTISAALFLVVFLADLFGWHSNPYVGIVFFLILPGIFLLGLALIPLGAFVERRRRARGLAPTALHWPRLDLNDPAQRYTAVVVFMLTVANIVIVSAGGVSWRRVHGLAAVLRPGLPHGDEAGVGRLPGRPALARRVRRVPRRLGRDLVREIEGLRRPAAAGGVAHYHRPITGPVRDMRPARATCVQCHWPEQHHGESVTMFTVNLGAATGSGWRRALLPH